MLLVVALWEYPKVPLWKLTTIIIASIMSAVAIMEKGMLFFLFISVLFILYEKRTIRIRSILISIVYADTKVIDGKVYGQTVIKRPKEEKDRVKHAV